MLNDVEARVLKSFAAQGLKVYRHPEDLGPKAGTLLAAKQLAAEGWLHRSTATGYFAITEMGLKLASTF